MHDRRWSFLCFDIISIRFFLHDLESFLSMQKKFTTRFLSSNVLIYSMYLKHSQYHHLSNTSTKKGLWMINFEFCVVGKFNFTWFRAKTDFSLSIKSNFCLLLIFVLIEFANRDELLRIIKWIWWPWRLGSINQGGRDPTFIRYILQEIISKWWIVTGLFPTLKQKLFKHFYISEESCLDSLESND